MGKIAHTLLPAVRTPRSVQRREQQAELGTVGGALVKLASANGWTPGDLVKAVQREAARSSDVSALAAALTSAPGRSGLDPTMGAPFASWDNRGVVAQMGPGEPAHPFPLGGEPRQWQYRVGWNFPTPPDTDRGIDGDLLRTLADSFDLLRLCIQVRKSAITQLQWDVVPVEKNRAKRDEWMKENAADLERIKQFFEWPEAYTTQDAAGHWVRRGKVKFEDWLGALLEEHFVGDWLTIWPRQLMSGDLLAFDRVDGSTVKVLLDVAGRLPEPPMPAYQQYLYGVPRASFTLEELIYRPRLLRNQTPYGFSHVEQMLVLINLALRFQMWTTQAYTDGALPLGLLTFPEGYTPDQIQAVIDVLNAATSGLAGARQQFHGVPFGTTWQDLKPFQFDETFAQFVVEYTAAMFGLSAQDLGFMPGRGGQGLGGKGFAEQQAENADEKATLPDARWVEGLMNELIERYFGRNDLEFVFTDLQDTDEASQIEADKEAILAGLKSWDRALEERGEEPVGVSEPFIVIGNVPWAVSDIKAIQEGEPRGQQAPALPVSEDDEPEDGGAGVVSPAVPGSGGPGQRPLPSAAPADGPPGQAADREDERGDREPGEQLGAGRQPAVGDDSGASPDATRGREQRPGPKNDDEDTRRDGKQQANAESAAAERDRDDDDRDTEDARKFDTGSGMQPHGLTAPDVDELRRWKRMATKAAREGRRIRPFETSLIPDAVKTVIATKLARPRGAWDDEAYVGYVRGVFDAEIAKAAAGTKSEPAPVAAGVCVRAADTGRILMLQRSISDADDPARGTWEFPGGHVEDDEQPFEAAVREWEEETGVELPPGTIAGSYRSDDGVYECFVYVVPSETDVPLNVDSDDRAVANPDDPDGDDAETLAWWAPSHAAKNPALRQEAKASTDWEMIGDAVPDAAFKAASASRRAAAHPMGEAGLEWAHYRAASDPTEACATCAFFAAGRCSMFDAAVKASMVCDEWAGSGDDQGDQDSEREKRIKLLAAAGAAALATRAAVAYGTRVGRDRITQMLVDDLTQHYLEAAQAGALDAAQELGLDAAEAETLQAIATGRAEASRPWLSQLVEQGVAGDVNQLTVNALARGAKGAYEQGYGATVTQTHPQAECVWVANADPCDLCEAKDGEVFTLDTLPGYPGDGDFGDTCEGGPQCRCELEWRIPQDGDEEEAASE